MHWEAGTSQEGNSSVTQGPQSRWDIGSWDNPQWLPVPPDTALGTLRLVTGQAAASGWGFPPRQSRSHPVPGQDRCAHSPRQPAHSHGRASGSCHGTSSPICLSSPLRAPFAAHLRSHMAEAERKLQRRRRRRRRSPSTIAARARSPAWRRCRSPIGTGLVNARSPATTPLLPPRLHTPEPPPRSVSHLSCLIFVPVPSC